MKTMIDIVTFESYCYHCLKSPVSSKITIMLDTLVHVKMKLEILAHVYNSNKEYCAS